MSEGKPKPKTDWINDQCPDIAREIDRYHDIVDCREAERVTPPRKPQR